MANNDLCIRCYNRSRKVGLYENFIASFKSLGYNKDTGKNEYEMYEVDPETLEAVKWESYNYSEPLVEEYYLVLQDGKIITNKGSFTKKK